LTQIETIQDSENNILLGKKYLKLWWIHYNKIFNHRRNWI